MEADAAALVGAAQEHDAALGMPLQVEPPALWKRQASGRRVDPVGVPVATCVDVAARARAEICEVSVAEAAPHLLLPEQIEALDIGLEAVLAWRGEHDADPEAQA